MELHAPLLEENLQTRQRIRLRFFLTETKPPLHTLCACKTPVCPFVEFVSLALGRLQLRVQMQDILQPRVLRDLLESRHYQ